MMKTIFRKAITLTICMIGALFTQAQELVGTIEGDVSVSPSGGATYSIPIATAKGVSDLAPQISLNYNSQSGNGIAGYGFNIGGLSAITRGPKSHYFDGNAYPTSTEDDGALYLDGMRLICVSGNPGKEGAVYKTEAENYTKITMHGSGTSRYLRVQTPDGKTYLYGNTPASRLTYNANTLSWLLKTVEDKDGHYITYDYLQSNNYMYLRTIEYGKSRRIQEGELNKLTFTYETRQDPVSFVAFKALPGKMVNRLSSIKSSIGNNVFREYVLNYDFNTFSQLAEVTMKGTDGKSYRPTRFTWSSLPSYDPGSRSASVTGYTEKPFSDQTFFTADTNGDGKSDLIGVFPYRRIIGDFYEDYTMVKVYESHSGTYTTLKSTTQYLLPSDIMFDDMHSYKTGGLVIHLDGSNKGYPIFPIYQRLGSSASEFGFFIPFINSNTPMGPSLVASHEVPAYGIADLNNDGVEEIILIEKGKLSNRYPGKIMSLSVSSSQKQVTADYQDLSFNLPSNPQKIIMADFDSDGFVDMLVAHETGIRIYRNMGGRNNPVFSDNNILMNSTAFNGKSDAFEVGDFNGDGFVDILVNDENSTTWKLGLSIGLGHQNPIKLSNITIRNTDKNYFFCFVQDFDGDGKSDLIVGNKSNTLWCKSTGTSMTIVKNISTTTTTAPRRKHIVQGDFKGNGRAELLHYGRSEFIKYLTTDGWYEYYNNNMSDATNKIIKINNGINKATRIGYSNLLNSEVHVAHDDAKYPVVDLKIPLTVVKSFSEGAEATVYYPYPFRINNSFKYEGGKLHMLGKGFMGFKKITSTGYRSKKEVTNDFNNTYYISYPTIIKEYGNNNSLKTTTNHSYNLKPMGKRYEMEQTSINVTDHINGNNQIIAYSDYQLGTARKVEKKYNDDSLVETTNTVLKHDSLNGKWILGLPTSVITKKESGGMGWIDKIVYTYNTDNRVTQAVTYTGVDGTKKVQTDKYTYKTSGKIDAAKTIPYNTTDELSTTYVYSTNERDLLSVTDALGRKDTYTYDAYGRVSTHRNYKSALTQYQYDSFGRSVKTIFPDGTIESFSMMNLDYVGKAYSILNSVTGQPGRLISYDYFNREIRIDTGHWDGTLFVEKHYDAAFDAPSSVSHPTKAFAPSIKTDDSNGGNILSRSGSIPIGDGDDNVIPGPNLKPTMYTYYTYDDYDRPIREYETDGKDNIWSYNANSVTENINGIIRTKKFDPAGRLIEVTDVAGTITYDLRPDGQPTSIDPPGGSSTTVSFAYDDWGRQLSITDPSAGKHEYTYDAWGNIKTSKDARNNITTHTYDKYGRLLKKVSPETTTDYTYSYSNLTKETSTNSTRTWAYDVMDRIISESETETSAKKSLKKDYVYTDGNISSINYTLNNATSPIGTEKISYSAGTPKDIYFNEEIVQSLHSANDRGQTKALTTGSTICGFEYDSFGVLKTMETIHSLEKRTIINYNFDRKTGNLTSQNKRGVGQEDFIYDNLDRLIQCKKNASNTSYSYDTKGNMSRNSSIGNFTYNTSSKPYAISSATFQTGSNAAVRNQDIEYTSFKAPASISENGYTAQLSYNGANSRVKMVLKTNSQPLKTSINNVGFGLSTGEKVLLTGGNTTQLTRYYLGNQYEIDETPSGSKEKLYIGGDYYSAPAVYVKENNTWKLYHIHRDYLGSIINITAGKVFDYTKDVENISYDYDAWGRLRNPSTHQVYAKDSEPSLFLGRGYTGHEHLPWFGLVNMNARLYDPVVGRFLSPDPYVQMPDFSQNYNRYSYALNNPLKYTDPSGEVAWIIPAIAAGAGGLWNWFTNFVQGNITSVGHGFSTFGVGAVSGLAVISAGPVASGAILGGGNSVVNQGFSSGWDNIDVMQVGTSTIMGGITSYVGGEVGKQFAKPLTSLTQGIQSDVLRNMLTQSAVNGATGFTLGTGFSLMNGDSFGDAVGSGAKFGFLGMTSGAISGAITGYGMAVQNQRNPWTGRSNNTIHSFEDLLSNPSLLENKSLEEIRGIIGNSENWVEGTLNHGNSSGRGWTLNELNSRGDNFTDRYIQYHPGTPRHFDGQPYWKFSSGEKGTLRFKANK